jgi:hypothetical protein
MLIEDKKSYETERPQCPLTPTILSSISSISSYCCIEDLFPLREGKKNLSENNSHRKNMKYVCAGGQALNTKETSFMHGHEREDAKR